MNHVTNHFSSADIIIFLPKIRKFCYIETCRYRFDFGTYFLIVLTSFESSMIVLVNMVTMMMSAKMATLGLLKKYILK